MKRIRIHQFSRQWLATATARSATTSSRASQLSRPATAAAAAPAALHSQIRCQSTTITPETIFDEAEVEAEVAREPSEESTSSHEADLAGRSLPSPHPDRALRSAKLAALHARLALSSKVPHQVLARALVDPSADPHPRFNNANLAFVGASLLQYHTSEWLVTRYPRLPMAILFAAMKGYSGDSSLHLIARAWGIEAAAAPGEEVDPGYLQFADDKTTVRMHSWGYARAEAKELLKYKWRRGMSSRIVYDDPFGDTVPEPTKAPEGSDARDTKNLLVRNTEENAHANFVRAVIGAIYLNCGSEAAKTFIKSHMLSRQLDLSNLFDFRLPQLELIRLCNRENFDQPVARLLSETGRASRSPVFVVGIYSGYDMLGEAPGPSLEAAKISACINALKSWYLYSPVDVGLPSDTFAEDAAPWKPAYVDMGEIIS
ncbi:ribonuclease III [Xylaria sp. FL1042]|nr:ribonuclease III [Xylaria sp. FL1042]KAI0435407.1 ribonuclease III [Xylaria sp. FL1042]